MECCRYRLYITKHKVSSPTLLLISLILSLIIDTQEGCDIAISDVVGSGIRDHVIIELDSDTVKVISKINAKYISPVTTEKGRTVSYVKF